jgi:hypothetical protein
MIFMYFTPAPLVAKLTASGYLLNGPLMAWLGRLLELTKQLLVVCV